MHKHIFDLQDNKLITSYTGLKKKTLPNAGSIKVRNNHKSGCQLLNKDLKKRYNELREGKNIIIKKSGKSNIFVIFNTTDYNRKN